MRMLSLAVEDANGLCFKIDGVDITDEEMSSPEQFAELDRLVQEHLALKRKSLRSAARPSA